MKKFYMVGKKLKEDNRFCLFETVAKTKKEAKNNANYEYITPFYNEIFTEEEWELVSNEVAVTKRQYTEGLKNGSFQTWWYEENKLKQSV